MNIKNLSFGCAVLAASVVQAAAVDFPGAGGDLASAADWGGTRSAATESVNLVNAGTYTLSDDVTFSQLLIPTAGSTLSFGAKTFTITSTGTFGFHVTAPGLTVVDGGTFDLSGKANFHGAYNNYKGKIHTVLTNGCLIRNVNTFYATRYSEGNTTEVTGGSKVYTEEIRLTNDDSYDNTFEVSGGSEIHLTNRFYFDVNAKTAGVHGGNKFIVRGEGSLYHQVNSYMMQLGNQQHDDLFWVTDGARAYSENGGINVGNGATTNAQVRIDDRATATFPSVDIRGTDGLVTVANCATATITKLTFTKGRNKLLVTDGANATVSTATVNSEGNAILVTDGANATVSTAVFNAGDNSIRVSNSTFTASANLDIGQGVNASNNLLRIYGSQSKAKAYGMFFGNGGHHNVISVEAGAEFAGTPENMLTNGHHCVLRLTGEGTRFGNSKGTGDFYWGCAKSVLGQVQNSYSNTLYVGDGAKLEVARCVIAGQDNQLVVSNATVNFCDDSVGLRVGYNNAKVKDGNRVVLQGTTPKIYSVATANSFWFQNNSTLRFEIPEEGYAEEHVPIELTGCSFYIDVSNSKVEIDCDKFVEKTGGKLHLIHSKNKIDTSSSNNIKSYLLNQVKLPAGARIIVDGGDVYLKSPKRTGLTVIIR